jgi:cyclic pyranopterin phosphate synthase
MPKEGIPRLTHEDILRYEEILRLARIAIRMGITKVRITGGEPLIRKDILYLCENIAQLPGLQSISLTTNGVLLSSYARALFQAGIKRVNISLDTLNPDKFAAITRKDFFHEVWRSIKTAQEVGFYPIKLNVVMMRGVNDDEIKDLASLTYRYPFHVRFIEFMPFGTGNQSQQFLSADELLSLLRQMAPLIPVKSSNSNGPAQHYRFPGALGKIGIISPVSHHFCPTCNRLRLTADGKLRTCLFATEETDLKTPLRDGATDEEIIALIHRAIHRKPENYLLDRSIFRKCISRPMSAIGG